MLENDAVQSRIKQLIQELFALNFSQPPRKIDVHLDERSLVVYLEDFVGDEMQCLVEAHDPDALRSVRELLVEHTIPNLTKRIAEETGLRIVSFHYDWSDYNLSAVLFGLRDEESYRQRQEEYPGKVILHENIAAITHEIEKTPDFTYSYWPSDNILVLVREGILIKIEKAFIDQGASGVLRKVKRNLEKTIILEEGNIEKTLNRKLKGIYLDWAFPADKSFLICVFEDKNTKRI